MKRLFCILLSISMLLSLAACGKPDPEQVAFEEACALLEAGKYQEAYAALTALESYRRIQEKIDEAAAGIEAQRLAGEEAAMQTELEQLGFLCDTTWHELGGTIDLTFEEYQNGGSLLHCRYWNDWGTLESFDIHWKFINGEIRTAYFPGLDPDVNPELGHLVTPEERDGVTHLLVGDLDFVRSEDYGPFAPVEIEITIDNWQEYFEILEGQKWEYDDFGTACGVRLITAIALKEGFRDRLVLPQTSVAFGYTYDNMERAVQAIDFEAQIAQTGGVTFISNTDTADTKIFGLESYDLTTDNDSIAEFPQIYCQLTSGFYSPANAHFEHHFYTCEDHVIDRAAGTLVLIPE